MADLYESGGVKPWAPAENCAQKGEEKGQALEIIDLSKVPSKALRKGVGSGRSATALAVCGCDGCAPENFSNVNVEICVFLLILDG